MGIIRHQNKTPTTLPFSAISTRVKQHSVDFIQRVSLSRTENKAECGRLHWTLDLKHCSILGPGEKDTCQPDSESNAHTHRRPAEGLWLNFMTAHIAKVCVVITERGRERGRERESGTVWPPEAFVIVAHVTLWNLRKWKVFYKRSGFSCSSFGFLFSHRVKWYSGPKKWKQSKMDECYWTSNKTYFKETRTFPRQLYFCHLNYNAIMVKIIIMMDCGLSVNSK